MEICAAEVIKLLSCQTQLKLKFQLLINTEYRNVGRIFRFILPKLVIYPANTYSPADIWLDPEMRFKLFFLADSCCLDVTINESD